MVILCLAALLAAVGPASPASAQGGRSRAVRTIDDEIAHAQHRIDRWNRVLQHWQVRVGRAAARVQRVSTLSPANAVRVPGYLSPRMANHVVWFPLTPEERTVRAHRMLQRILRDHRAIEAQQQQQVWSAYLMQLQDARRQAVAAAHRGTGALPAGPVTYEAWARAFLATVGAPRCDENVVLTVAWETAESTAALYNPLATTHDMPGAGIFNTAGVRNYVSLDQGLEAARDTLENGAESYVYGAILTDLRGCAPAETTAAAIRDSAWCRGCAAGAYVIGLLPAVRDAWAEHATRLIATTS
jgi:hypothetical protein